MMKAILITITSILVCSNLLAQQARFTSSGIIEYEKSINMNALFKKLYGNDMQSSSVQAYWEIQKTKPQFKVLKSNLTFNNNKSLFTPVVPETMASDVFNTPMADQINIIFSDYNAHTHVVQKNVADANVLIADTLRKIKWKYTDETRTIAGYTCRRANGLMLDSIYVVAYYTDKIAIPGGPESFGGLPGMILEVAVPHENVIWKATKITDVTVPAATILPPKKGKIYTNKQFFDFIKNLIGNRGWQDQANLALKGYLL